MSLNDSDLLVICQRCLKESHGRNEVNSYTVSDMSEMFEGEPGEK